MERKDLPDGLVWRKRKDGSHFECIYFKKQYRGHRLRGSSGTSDPKEAERRLRNELTRIDNAEIYGVRPDYTFNQAVSKMIDEFQGSPATLRIYGQQADILSPWIGNMPIRFICKDVLMPFIEHRNSEEVSVRTINIAIELVRRALRLATYYWRDPLTKLSWLDNCPIIPFEKGPRKKAHPLSWDQQETFFDLLPGIKRRMALFDVNTGLRERSLVNLRWEWEVFSPAINETVFHIPGKYMKNGKDSILVVNRIARQSLEAQRGFHPELVWGPVKQMTDSTWKKCWRESGLTTGKEYCKGVHNLRHTFGKRLRDAGVDERDVQDLLHHVPKNVTRDYSEPEIKNLKKCVELIVPKPTLSQVA
jgi:integrase